MGVTLFCVVFVHDSGKELPLRLRAEYAIKIKVGNSRFCKK